MDIVSNDRGFPAVLPVVLVVPCRRKGLQACKMKKEPSKSDKREHLTGGPMQSASSHPAHLCLFYRFKPFETSSQPCCHEEDFLI
jgi:hypothetical protein